MFSISAKTQYAIRAMTCLAKHHDRSMTSAEIARIENIPQKYLEGILVRLKTSGLLQSERGQKGGYKIIKDPSNILMIDIIEALEGKVKPVLCMDPAQACQFKDNCNSRNFWLGLKTTIDDYFMKYSLKDLSEGIFI